MDFFTKVNRSSKATQETIKPLVGSEALYIYHTPAGVFSSRSLAMKANNCGADALMSRCKRASFPDWFRVPRDGVTEMLENFRSTMKVVNANKKGQPNPASKPVMTPNGPYPSISAVVRASGRPRRTVRSWFQIYPDHYYFIKENV